MEVTLEAAERQTAPEDTFLSFYIGSYQKQSRFDTKKARKHKFPDPGDDRRNFGRIEVFKRFGTACIDFTNLIGKSYNVEIPCRSEEMPSIQLRVAFPAAGDKPESPGKTPEKTSKTRQRLDDAQIYVKEHGLEDLLTESLNKVILERPKDPHAYLSNEIQRRHGKTKRSEPSPDTTAELPAQDQLSKEGSQSRLGKIDVCIEVAEGQTLPEDTFVFFRIGSNQKQSRLDVTKAIKHQFPEGDHSRLRIEVFRRIGASFVYFSNFDGKADHVDVPCKDLELPSLQLKVAVQANAKDTQPSDDVTGKTSKARQRLDDAQEYVKMHQLDDLLGESLRKVISERPEDPHQYLSDEFLRLQQLANLPAPAAEPEAPAAEGPPNAGGKNEASAAEALKEDGAAATRAPEDKQEVATGAPPSALEDAAEVRKLAPKAENQEASYSKPAAEEKNDKAVEAPKQNTTAAPTQAEAGALPTQIPAGEEAPKETSYEAQAAEAARASEKTLKAPLSDPATKDSDIGRELIDGVLYVEAAADDAEHLDLSVLESERINMIRTAMRSCGLDEAQKIAHLKGFASGLRRDPDFDMFCEKIIKQLEDGKFTVLVWDGDDYNDHSFTCILPLIREKLPNLRFVAFLCRSQRYKRWGNDAGFHGSWKDRLPYPKEESMENPRLTCFLVDDYIEASQRYEALGVLALQATAARTVFLIGGGETARLEVALMARTLVQYMLFDAVRVKNDLEIHSDLLGAPGVKVVLRSGITVETPPTAIQAARELSQSLNESGTSQRGIDPRWDIDAFKKWTIKEVQGCCAAAFVKIGYLRHLQKYNKHISKRQDLPFSALHCGTPPDWLAVYNVIAPWESADHADPNGKHLRALVERFDMPSWTDGPREAADEDLLYWDFPCRFQGKLSELEQALNDEFDTESFRMYMCSRVKTIVLPGSDATGSDTSAQNSGGLDSLLRDGSLLYSVALSASCQPIVNMYDAAVKAGLNPENFANLTDRFSDPGVVAFKSDGNRQMISNLYAKAISAMHSVAYDRIGFEQMCQEAQLVWLKVSYLQWLVARGGPFPRRQDLHSGGFYIGNPAGHRKFVVSSPWASENHPSPSGMKLVNIFISLLKLNACDDDAVFIDFCSLPQKARDVPDIYYRNAAHIGKKQQSQRSRAENLCMTSALWDINRLYAYKECEVIISPALEDTAIFPVGPDAWGKATVRPYINRGWCCCEYAIAKFCKTIANADEPQVQAVDKSRIWPSTSAEYDVMLKEDVQFIGKGDGDICIFSFFRTCLGLASSP